MSVRAIAGASRTNSLSYRAQSTASSLLPVKAKAVSGAFGELLSQITGTAGKVILTVRMLKKTLA